MDVEAAVNTGDVQGRTRRLRAASVAMATPIHMESNGSANVPLSEHPTLTWGLAMLPSNSLIAFIGVLALPAAAFAQRPPAEAAVSVMLVAVFHMSNPGHDLHNLTVDDVLLPNRQAEIAKITDALMGFHPTKVMA